MRRSIGPALALALGGLACDSRPASPAPIPVSGTQVSMDFTLATGFYAAPFPSESRREPDGGIDLSSFPNPTSNTLVESVLSLIRGNADGFGISSGIYFQVNAPLAPTSLPDLYGSIAPGATVFLMSVDPTSPDYLQRHPVAVTYADDNGPYGATGLLSLLPLQGLPLQPHTLYAAAVLRDALDAQSQRLGVSTSMAQIASGTQPAGLSDAAWARYQEAMKGLAAAGIPAESLAGLSVFETWDPTATFHRFLADAVARPLPTPQGPFVLQTVYPEYCAYVSTIPMTEYQAGTPPYNGNGGAWVVDANGNPVPQRQEMASFLVTVPRQAMPAAGFPLVVFSSTGAGGMQPLINRGTQATPGGPPIVPGSGPGEFFAHVGWAGTSIDGPLEGLRSADGENEDYAIFNFDNPPALVDNIRQSALELALTAHLMPTIHFSAIDCPGLSTPGGGPVAFDPNLFVIMGHSMGGTISPLALSSEPSFKAGIFSGEGGSWIENVMYKENPLVVRPLAALLLDMPPAYELTEHDPLLTLLQWGGEPADPPAYAAHLLRQPGRDPAKHVLMFQGIVDTYILPAIANASSLSFGLDLAGEQYDYAAPPLAQFTPLRSLLPLSGGSQIALPATGNRVAGNGATVTAVVVQHVQDHVEDGHEEMFQTDPPKHQYGCFLQSLKSGTPTVPTDGAALDPCP